MNSTTTPCRRAQLFTAVHDAAMVESVDVAALVAQTALTEDRVREVLTTLLILADAEAAAMVTGVSLAQALTARRQAIDLIAINQTRGFEPQQQQEKDSK